MPGALPVLSNELGKSAVKRTAFRWRELRVDRRGEQGVGESDDPVIDDHRTCVYGQIDLLSRVVERMKQSWRRVVGGSGKGEELPNTRRKPCESRPEQFLKRLGQGQWSEPAPVDPAELSRELECEERIPTRRSVHSGKKRPRDAHVKPLSDEVYERAGTQTVQVEVIETICLECLRKTEQIRTIASQRCQNTHRQVAESARGKGKDPQRRRVEPLHIIDRDQNRGFGGSCVQNGEKCSCQQERIGSGIARRDSTERYRERSAMMFAQPVCRGGVRLMQQIGQAYERKREFCLHTTRG